MAYVLKIIHYLFWFFLALNLIYTDTPLHSGSNVLSGGKNSEENFVLDDNGNEQNAVVVGGGENNADGTESSILGGYYNKILGAYSSVLGGDSNYIADYNNNVIGGGFGNLIDTTIGATPISAAICGGRHNKSHGAYDFVGGGAKNISTGGYSAIVGGGSLVADGNKANSAFSIVGGGDKNIGVGTYSGVLAGLDNEIYSDGDFGFIGAGTGNDMQGKYGVICGGSQNAIYANDSLKSHGSYIGGGSGNSIVDAQKSVILGGANNSLVGDYSVIYGGSELEIRGASSFGFNASASNIIMLDDSSVSFLGVDFGIGTPSPATKLHIYDAIPRVLLHSSNSSTGANYFIEFGQNPPGFSSWDRTGWIGDGASQRRELQFSSTYGSYIGFYPEDQDVNNGQSTMLIAKDKVRITNYGISTQTLHFFVVGYAGGGTAWSYYSDGRLKDNINTINTPLNKLMKLNGVNYQWNSTTNRDNIAFKNRKNLHPDNYQIGFIAQELKEVLPEAVIRGDDGFYLMSYAPIFAVLVEGLKELEAKNRALLTQARSLEARIEKLEELFN